MPHTLGDAPVEPEVAGTMKAIARIIDGACNPQIIKDPDARRQRW